MKDSIYLFIKMYIKNDKKNSNNYRKISVTVQTLWLFRHRDQFFEVFRKSRYKPYVADPGKISSALLSIVISYPLLGEEYLKPS